jgi:hypothetical protein
MNVVYDDIFARKTIDETMDIVRKEFKVVTPKLFLKKYSYLAWMAPAYKAKRSNKRE